MSAFKGSGVVHIHRTSQEENFAKVESFVLEGTKKFDFTAKAVSIRTLHIEVESISELPQPAL